MRAVNSIMLASVIMLQPVMGAEMTCVTREERERIQGLMIQALDNAFRAHVQHMFEVWMKDSIDQPARARAGTLNGVKAYINAYQSSQHWEPPIC